MHRAGGRTALRISTCPKGATTFPGLSRAGPITVKSALSTMGMNFIRFYDQIRLLRPLNGLRKNTARARTLIPFPLQPSAQAPGLPGTKNNRFSGRLFLLRALFGPCGLGHINYVRDQCQLNDSRKIFKHKWENFNMMVMCGCKSPYTR